MLVSLAESHGYRALAVTDLAELLGEAEKGIGAAVITEEALHFGLAAQLAKAVESQPEWSDIPFIVIVSRSDPEKRSARTVGLSKPLGNVTMLERPLRPSTILSAFESALRDRRRQYALRDLLERYQELSAELEMRVHQRTEELSAANREMEGFTHSVAHDLRAPLRAIHATSMILAQEYGELLPKEAHEELERQAAASRKLAKLIDDLLQLSRVSRKEMVLEEVDVSAMVRELAGEIEERDGNKHIHFSVENDLELCGDPILLRLAFSNLLENAVKFSPAGGEIQVSRSNGTILVRDNGIGFDQAYASKVFRPFERLVSEKDFPGTGIGLANVERIVTRHGGRVWVESELGKGSTFYLSL